MTDQDNFFKECQSQISKQFTSCMVLHKDYTISSQDKTYTITVRGLSIENPGESYFHIAIIANEIKDWSENFLFFLINEINTTRQQISITAGGNSILETKGFDHRKAIFSRQIYIYINQLPVNWNQIEDLYKSKHDLQLLFRDKRFLERYKILDKKEIFLCHDISDKDLIEVIHRELIFKGISPWLDTACIQLGDNIIDKMNEGLKNCQYALVIFSSNFIKNTRWARKEFESLLHLALHTGKCIIPVWRGIGAEEILEYHPAFLSNLAQKISPPPVIDEKEIQQLIRNIICALK